MSYIGQLQLILQSFTLPSEIQTQMQEMLKNVTDISEVIVEHFVDSMTKNDQSPDGMERKLLIELIFFC